MKKFVGFFLLLIFSLALFSCGVTPPTTTKDDPFLSPLFRFQVAYDRSRETRIQYLPLSDGFFYCHPSESGSVCGFVSPTRSLSSEALLEFPDKPSSLSLIETSEDHALIFTEEKAYLLNLKGGGTEEFPLHKNVDYSRVLPYRSLHFLAETKDLIVLQSFAMEEPKVLAEKADLPGFSRLLTTSDDGRLIWYATADENGFNGIGCFEYGSSSPLKTESFPYQNVQTVAEGKLLFTRILEDGSALYLFRDTDQASASSLSFAVPADSVTADPSGCFLAMTSSQGDGGTVSVWRFTDQAQVFIHPSEYGNPSPELAFDKDGKTLLVAIGKGKDELIGTFTLPV